MMLAGCHKDSHTPYHNTCLYRPIAWSQHPNSLLSERFCRGRVGFIALEPSSNAWHKVTKPRYCGPKVRLGTWYNFGSSSLSACSCQPACSVAQWWWQRWACIHFKPVSSCPVLVSEPWHSTKLATKLACIQPSTAGCSVSLSTQHMLSSAQLLATQTPQRHAFTRHFHQLTLCPIKSQAGI